MNTTVEFKPLKSHSKIKVFKGTLIISRENPLSFNKSDKEFYFLNVSENEKIPLQLDSIERSNFAPYIWGTALVSGFFNSDDVLVVKKIEAYKPLENMWSEGKNFTRKRLNIAS